jgi:hypothetical protein
MSQGPLVVVVLGRDVLNLAAAVWSSEGGSVQFPLDV